MSPRILALCFVSVLVAASSQAQFDFCKTGQAFGPLFCGTAWKLSANSFPQEASDVQIMICDSTFRTNCFRPRTECHVTPDGNRRCHDWRTTEQRTTGVGIPCSPSKGYFLYAFSIFEAWGSWEVPIDFFAASPCGLTAIRADMPPRPLSPDPIFPIGTGVSPSNLFVTWKSGIDAARSHPSWPVVYDILFKNWQPGQPEPQNFTLSATLPCNANWQGNCSTFVEQINSGLWKWKVVARMDVSVSVSPSVRPAIFRQESAEVSFEANYSGRPPGCCR